MPHNQFTAWKSPASPTQIRFNLRKKGNLFFIHHFFVAIQLVTEIGRHIHHVRDVIIVLLLVVGVLYALVSSDD